MTIRRATILGAALALAAVPVAALSARGKTSRPWAFSVPELVKLGPAAKVRPGAPARLAAARGECVATQIVAPAPVRGLVAKATPLRLRGAEPIRPVLYREVFLDLAHPSNVEGRAGRWPDPLIPAFDPYRGEERNAFPASSEGPEPVAVYVEICVPAKARAGTYSGEVRLEAQGRAALRIPVELKVRPFALPATASLPTSFGFSGITAARGHGLPADRALELTRLYGIAALQHRLSLHGMSMEPPAIASVDPPRLDFTAYDAEVGPFLDGTVLPSGARFTSIDVRMHPKARGDAQRIAYLRAYVAHLKEKGWFDRAFIYLKDEPKPQDLPEVRRLADLVRKADPGLRRLVTTSLVPPIDGAIDLWTPNLNCLFARPGDDYCRLIVPIEGYSAERKRGAHLWWYQSCGSHGCGPVPGADLVHSAYFSGWPSYMVDADATLNRAMGVLAFRNGIEGELYFNTVEAYLDAKNARPADPWTDLWRFDGNGDGTLFYPGTPAKIGGKSHVPVDSLRLKHLRAGLQDYEYLRLARSHGLGELADAAARELARQPFEIARDPKVWERVRERLAAQIERAQGAKPEYVDDEGVQGKGRR